MRHFQAVVALALGVLAGCVSPRPDSGAPAASATRPLGPAGDDLLHVQFAVIERPAGDPALNAELWELADEQGVNLDHKPVLEENGFRVCSVGGQPPASLQRLLSSPSSCPDPRALRVAAGNPVAIPLGQACPRCAYVLRDTAEEKKVVLQAAQPVLELFPTLAEDGLVKVRFTPRVRHGKARIAPTACQDPAGDLRLSLEQQQPEETYPWLSWELTVAADEYVVVGTRLEREDTLGYQLFVNEDGLQPVQRLLVIRVARLQGGAPLDESISRSPPLALQAGWTSARGSAP